MNSPYEVNNGFQFWFKFLDFNNDWYEVPELPGFDAAKFSKEQKEKGWARTYEYAALDKLEVPDAYGIKLITPRQINPRGDLFDHMDYGLQWFLAARKNKGFEMKVEFKLTEFGVDFRTFECDTRDPDLTDGKNYFKFKLIPIGIVADHLRNYEKTFDAFSDKNWKDEPILPIVAENFLYKAPALNNTTIFNGNGTTRAAQSTQRPNIFGTGISKENIGANNANSIELSEINNTLSFIYNRYVTVDRVDSNGINRQIPNDSTTFQYIEFKNDSFNVSVKFSQIVAIAKSQIVDFGDTAVTSASGYANLLVVIGNDLENEPFDCYEIHRKDFGFESSAPYNFPSDLSLIIPYVSAGRRMYVYFSADSEVEFNNFDNTAASYSIFNSVYGLKCTINIIEKPLNYVIKATRYFNLLERAGTNTNNLPTVAKKWDVGGKFHDWFVFNRSLVANKETLKLTTTPKDIYESLEIVAGDVEISREKIYIEQYEGFYENVEIGAFLILPSKEYSEPFDETYRINDFKFGFQNFESEKTVKGTSQGIHTDSEWEPKNERANNKKEIKIKVVWDPFKTQTMVNNTLNKPETAIDSDDMIHAQTAVRLAPNSFEVINRRLYMIWQNGRLEILNRDNLGETNDLDVVWSSVGIALGSTVQIIDGKNIGTYTVFSVDSTVIILTPTTPIIQFEGVGPISLKHYYTNVLWQTETNEDFAVGPADFPNLKRSIKRNILEPGGWLLYLAAALMNSKGRLKKNFFKNNETLETRLYSETVSVIEGADIPYADFPEPLVEPILIKETIAADFNAVKEYLDNYENKKGYARLYDLEGNVKFVYGKLFEDIMSTNKAEIVGQKKYQNEYLRISIVGNTVYVNDAPYNYSGNANWYITENDEIKLYDEKSRPLSEFYNYEFVILDGLKYNSISDLVTALSLYQWT